jgi:hypothetical protein
MKRQIGTFPWSDVGQFLDKLCQLRGRPQDKEETQAEATSR